MLSQPSTGDINIVSMHVLDSHTHTSSATLPSPPSKPREHPVQGTNGTVFSSLPACTLLTQPCSQYAAGLPPPPVVHCTNPCGRHTQGGGAIRGMAGMMNQDTRQAEPAYTPVQLHDVLNRAKCGFNALIVYMLTALVQQECTSQALRGTKTSPKSHHAREASQPAVHCLLGSNSNKQLTQKSWQCACMLCKT